MLTMREYARTKGVSYEAVRRQVVRYAEELEGHTTKQNKLVFLDEYAQEFLDKHRLQRTVIVEPTDKEVSDELAQLREEIDRLKNRVVSQQDQIIELQKEKIGLIESKAKYTALIETHEETEKKLMNVEIELHETRSRLQEAEQEAASYHKSWFGFYRKDT